YVPRQCWSKTLILLRQPADAPKRCTIGVRTQRQRTRIEQVAAAGAILYKLGPMDRYVVIGNPIAHSLSPTIHAQFAQLVGEDVDYSILLAPVGQFAQSARAFFDAGGRGANVTLPFKVEAFELAS